jgi:hypothetical protein
MYTTIQKAETGATAKFDSPIIYDHDCTMTQKPNVDMRCTGKEAYNTEKLNEHIELHLFLMLR